MLLFKLYVVDGKILNKKSCMSSIANLEFESKAKVYSIALNKGSTIIVSSNSLQNSDMICIRPSMLLQRKN